MRLLNIKSRTEIAKLTQPQNVWSLAFSGDGSVLAAGCADGTVNVYSVASSK